jgi:Rieske 2Fe-2S family protein
MKSQLAAVGVRLVPLGERRKAMADYNKVRALMQSRKPSHPLPGAFYVDPDIYEADLDCIFYREWVFAGHTFELEKPGSYMTLQIGRYPIIVIRGRNGEIYALHNVCRHRGSLVCTQENGRASRLVCPYHQWSYDLDGRLLFARSMGDGFDKEMYGLKRVHCEVVNSFIFVCLAETPRDFATFRNSLSAFLSPHKLDNARVAHETSIVEKGNWKLTLENNRECYHCKANHPQLLRSFVENPTVAGQGASEQDSEVTAHWARCERAGFPSTLQLDEDGQFRMTRIPLAEGTRSYTMSGEPAVGIPLGEAGDRDLGALLMFHYPSAWSHILADHAVTFRVLPISPTETLLTTKWIVNGAAEENRDYRVDDLIEVWTATNEQDKQIVERASIGVSSPAYAPGPFSEEEGGPNQLIDWYCSFMSKQVNEALNIDPGAGVETATA